VAVAVPAVIAPAVPAAVASVSESVSAPPKPRGKEAKGATAAEKNALLSDSGARGEEEDDTGDGVI
jgi:hypothetical protein